MITVLMPVYNAEKYLKEAIESILNQTFKKFEFLIINDGSTDSSVDIIKSYTDARIRLIHNDRNYGITYTLNRGIYLAANEFIARMDADDISHPERLEKQFNFIIKNPDCGLIASLVSIISSEGKFKKVSGRNPKYYYFILLFSAGVYHSSVMYRKSIIKKIGLYSKEYGEDFNLWCKLIKNFKFCVIPEILLSYRISETSLWRVSKKNEYEKAHDQQIHENVNFYTNNKCHLEDYEIQFFKGNEKPIVAYQNQNLIIDCFKKLDFITLCLQSIQNINNEKGNIKEAAFYYKLNLFKKLSKHIKQIEVIQLIIRLQYWSILFKYVQYRMKLKSKNMFYTEKTLLLF